MKRLRNCDEAQFVAAGKLPPSNCADCMAQMKECEKPILPSPARSSCAAI